MAIRQLKPVRVGSVGYVEEVGWGHPAFFPYVPRLRHGSIRDKAATRRSFADPAQAVAAAVAVKHGWGINDLGVLMQILTEGGRTR
jgi:hypothetical protein